jgi:hypothetical protein
MTNKNFNKKTILGAILLSLLLFCANIPGCIAHSEDGCGKKIVSGLAKDVGLKNNNSVVIKTVPEGKKFILTDIVADRSYGTFRFNISDQISLSIHIKEYAIDKSPAYQSDQSSSWHFYSGIPFKAGMKIEVNKVEGAGDVFISGYIVDDN